jgi:hypothetical protein
MIEISKEERLKNIVNRVFNLDIMCTTRKREVVEARMVYSNVLMGIHRVTLEHVGKFLNKSHCTIVHYNKNFNYIIKPDEELWRKYLLVSEIYTKTDHIANALDLEDCRKIIYSLENQIKSLTLKNERLNLEHKSYKNKIEIYPELFKLIDERVRERNVHEVTRKLNTYLNGIRN